MGTTYVLTGDFSDLIASDVDASKVAAYVRTNLPPGTALVDTTATADSVRLGAGKITIAADGTFSVTLLGTANTGLNVAANTLRYEVVAEYADRGTRERSTWHSGFFPLTANTDLKNVVPDSDAIAVASAGAYALEAKGYRDEAATITGLTGEDSAIANRINTPGSLTDQALETAYAPITGSTVYAAKTELPTAASASVAGTVELATTAETQTGTDTVRAITPAAAAESYGRKTTRVVGETNADHATLAAALAVAVSGDEIVLRAGTHSISGANTIPAGVRVRSAHPGGATIQGTYDTTVSALTLQAGATLEGLTIKNLSATGSTGVHVAADIRGAGAEVRNCVFVGPWAQAILAYQVTDVRVIDCTFDSIGRTTGSTPGDSINLYGVNGATVQGCLFRDCRQNALYVNASAKNVTLTGNTVRNCPEGVQVRVGCSNVTIVGNTFDIKGATGITSFGIIVQTQCTDTVIANNTFRTTAGTATPIAAISIDDRSHRAIIEGNSISGSGFAKGIAVATTAGAGNESTDAVIVGNNLDSVAGIAIHVATNEARAVINDNRIIGGTNKAIQVQASRATIVGNLVTSSAGTDGITASGSFCSIVGNTVTNVAAGAGILVTGTDNTITGNMCTANATYGISETGNSNVIVGNNVGGNSHATADINSAGAASKVAYNIGRYTAKGAA